MTISEKVAYLKGLAEGLNIDTDKSKEGKLINVIIGILEEIGMSIEDLEEHNQALGETIGSLSDDLAEVETMLEEATPDDDWYEVECPTCGAPIIVDEEALASGSVVCPSCGTKYALDQSEDEEENGPQDPDSSPEDQP